MVDLGCNRHDLHHDKHKTRWLPVGIGSVDTLVEEVFRIFYVRLEASTIVGAI